MNPEYRDTRIEQMYIEIYVPDHRLAMGWPSRSEPWSRRGAADFEGMDPELSSASCSPRARRTRHRRRAHVQKAELAEEVGRPGST